MNDFRRPAAFLASGLLLTLLAPAAARAAARIYTNEDLEGLAPLPMQAAPLAQDSPEDWRFVLDMLDRERSRLDVERTLQLERDRQTLLEKSVEEHRHETALYPIGWGGYGGAWGLRTGGLACSHRQVSIRPGFRGARVPPSRDSAWPAAPAPPAARR